MKILIDGRLLSNKPTGISRYTQELINFYIEKYGYDNVAVIVNKGLYQKNFNYFETDLKVYKILHFMFLHIVIKNIDFDIFHAPFYSNGYFKLKNKIYILTVHDLMYKIVQAFRTQGMRYAKIKYYDFIVSRSLKNSDHIITVSKTTATDLKSIFGRDSQTIIEGANYFDENKLANNIDITNEFNLYPNDYFLYVGNLKEVKNIDFMIAAFLKANTDKKLVICSADSISQTRLININRVIFLSFVDDCRLKILYQKCSAFIFPSKYEGFGLPILEALANGTKVFSSNAGALSEFPSEVVNFFDPYNEKTLIDLIENVDSINVSSEHVKNVLKLYSWKTFRKQMNDYLIQCGLN